MTLRRATAALACGAVLLPATAAAAVEPDRTGWWNRLSAGGLVVPQPTAQPGDLRVAAGPDGPSAYAAVLYTAPDATAATLDLAVRSAFGSPQIVACPTVTSDFEEGGNQPFAKAPEFDCDRSTTFGSPSEDGKTVSFALDDTSQLEPGVWSLAIVPAPDSSSGVFSVDFEKPSPEAFVVTSTAAEQPAAPSAPGTTSGGSTGGDPGGSAGSGEAFLPGGFDAPPPSDLGGTGAVDAPLLAGEMPTAATEPAAPAPAVAGGAAPVTRPLLLARPAAADDDLGAGRRLLGLLVLAGGSAAVGYAAGQQRSGPRLIGGRARGGYASATAAAATTPAVAAPAERPRGIGRFAKDRTAAPRRLR